MKIVQLNHENAKDVAKLMHEMKSEWWPTFGDAYAQLMDIEQCIGTVGWVLTEEDGRPVGWTLFRELKDYLTLELECSGYNDNGEFKLEHKLGALFDAATAYAREKGYTSLRTGMSSRDFNIDGQAIADIPEAMKALQTARIDYHWLLNYGFRVIGIQPNVYRNNCHLILFVKEL